MTVDGKRYVPVAWLVGVLVTAVLGMAGAWATALRADVEELKADRALVQADHEILIRVEAAVTDLQQKVNGLYRR